MKIHIENAEASVSDLCFLVVTLSLDGKVTRRSRPPPMTAPAPTLHPTPPPITATAPHVPPVPALPGRNETSKQLADVNGDGLMDSCSFVSAALSCDLGIRSGGFRSRTDSSRRKGLPKGTLVDVNRDGRADFCRYTSAEPNARLYVIWGVCAKKR